MVFYFILVGGEEKKGPRKSMVGHLVDSVKRFVEEALLLQLVAKLMGKELFSFSLYNNLLHPLATKSHNFLVINRYSFLGNTERDSLGCHTNPHLD